jgi:hypothetical protein
MTYLTCSLPIVLTNSNKSSKLSLSRRTLLPKTLISSKTDLKSTSFLLYRLEKDNIFLQDELKNTKEELKEELKENQKETQDVKMKNKNL